MWSALLRGVVLFGLTARVALAGEAGPPQLDFKQVEAGRMIYQQHCASCHGPRGEIATNWQVPDAQGELPPPPHSAEGHTWKHADAMLYWIVNNGWRYPFNKTRRLTMPAFGNQLSPEQIRDVITYLKTLWTPEQRQFQWEETLVRGGFPQASAVPPNRPKGDNDADGNGP